MKTSSISIYKIFTLLIIFFSVMVAVYGIGSYAAEPYYHKITVFYPLLILFHSKIFHLLGLSFLIFLELVAWKISTNLLARFVIVIIVLSTIILSFLTIWQFVAYADLDSKAEINFRDNLYYLTVNSGYVLGQDCDLTAYVIYKCDKLGLICQSFKTPYLDSYRDTQCTGKLTSSEVTRFIIDSKINTLFVQISDQKSIVEIGE